MKYEVDIPAGLETLPRIAHVTFEQLEAIGQVGQVLATPRGEVVEDANVMAESHESRRQMRPDESGPASYQDIGHVEFRFRTSAKP